VCDGVVSFTVEFAESGYDESRLARMVAERWGLDYHGKTVDPNELIGRFRRAAWYSDEPVAHASDVHLWILSEYAKPRVTVLLSGEGADETLGGYMRYQTLRSRTVLGVARWMACLMPVTPRRPRRLAKLVDYLRLGGQRSLVSHNAAMSLDASLRSLNLQNGETNPYRHEVLTEAEALYPGDLCRQAMYYDQHTYLTSLLERNDRMTMAASIECRVPFLDHTLVEGLAALPSRWLFKGWKGKHLLREIATRRIPSALLRNKKWGFGVPWARYLREQPALRDLVCSLPSLTPLNSAPFDTKSVRVLVDGFLEGETSGEETVFHLVMLATWHAEVCQRDWSRDALTVSPS
jgi:asparagine synthase (glutamine-hydrolysing)